MQILQEGNCSDSGLMYISWPLSCHFLIFQIYHRLSSRMLRRILRAQRQQLVSLLEKNQWRSQLFPVIPFHHIMNPQQTLDAWGPDPWPSKPRIQSRHQVGTGLKRPYRLTRWSPFEEAPPSGGPKLRVVKSRFTQRGQMSHANSVNEHTAVWVFMRIGKLPLISEMIDRKTVSGKNLLKELI